MIVNAENLILGRLASYVAKKILVNEEMIVVNCSKAIITGNKKGIIAEYKARISRGVPTKGPFFPKQPERIVRRTIRGMVPWRQARGKEVYKNVKCYRDVPDSLKGREFQTVKGANVSRIKNLKYITVGDLSKQIGGK